MVESSSSLYDLSPFNWPGCLCSCILFSLEIMMTQVLDSLCPNLRVLLLLRRELL